MGLFAKFKEAWLKPMSFDSLNEGFYDDLEEALILADVGMDTAVDAVAQLKKRAYAKLLTHEEDVKNALRDILAEKLGMTQPEMLTEEKIGRIGTLKCEIPLVEFTHFVIESLGCNGLRYTDCGKPVHRVAVGGGACGDYIGQAIALGCDTFVTSDLKYNDFLDTEGLNLVDAGHFPTENVVCPALRDRLQRAFPAVDVLCSTSHSREIIQYCIKEK